MMKKIIAIWNDLNFLTIVIFILTGLSTFFTALPIILNSNRCGVVTFAGIVALLGFFIILFTYRSYVLNEKKQIITKELHDIEDALLSMKFGLISGMKKLKLFLTTSNIPEIQKAAQEKLQEGDNFLYERRSRIPNTDIAIIDWKSITYKELDGIKSQVEDIQNEKRGLKEMHKSLADFNRQHKQIFLIYELEKLKEWLAEGEKEWELTNKHG